MSFIVERLNPENGRRGFTGPIRSLSQAHKEVAAWQDAGWEACALEYTADQKARVRAWQKECRVR